MAEVGDLSEIGGEMTIEWKIKNFSSLSNEEDIYYYSPRFYFSSASWKLKIYPNGETKADSIDWIDLYLVKASSDSPINLNYTLGFKTIDKEKSPIGNFTFVFTVKERGYGRAQFISKSELLEKKSELLPSDILTVTCTMKSSEPKDAIESHFNRLLDVSDNLDQIYLKAKKTDFKLKIQGDEIIYAHRLILETRSPVFAAMLSHDTTEHQTGEVCIEDLNKSAMNSIVRYIYSGDINKLTTENALSVYAAADKYDIKHIKKLCIKFIMDNLSVDWVCDIIKFADLYDEEELGSRAKEYFSKKAHEILDSQKWKTFIKENPLMGVELLSSVVKYSLPKNTDDK